MDEIISVLFIFDSIYLLVILIEYLIITFFVDSFVSTGNILK
jgi:hypothetical protein